MRPAVDYTTTSSYTSHLEWYYAGVHYPNGDMKYTWEGQRNSAKTPAGIENAFRPDGSRPPSPWYNQWCHANTLHGYHVWKQGSEEYRGNCKLVGSDPQSVLNTVCPWVQNSGSFPLAVENAARTRFLTKLSEDNWNLGTDLAELGETVAMFSEISGSVVRGVHKTAQAANANLEHTLWVLSRNSGKSPRSRQLRLPPGMPRRIGERIINAWLLVQFGIRPLLSSYDDGLKAFDTGILGPEATPTVSCKGGVTVTDVHMAVDTGYQSFDRKAVADIVSEIACHISATYRVASPEMRRLNGLGLVNPAAIAYELVSYSWMLDYLTTTGSWINSWSAASGLSFVEGTITRIAKITSAGQAELIKAFPGTPWLLDGKQRNTAVYQLDCGRMERHLLTDGVAPASFPTWKNRLNMGRIANSLAALSKIRPS